MAQTASAIAIGLANYRDDVKFAGLIANNCGTERHAQLIIDSLPDTLPLLSIFPRDESVALPERHLGLVQPSEVGKELDERIDKGADQLTGNRITELPESVEFFAVVDDASSDRVAGLKGITIAIACDAAFSFYLRCKSTIFAKIRRRIGIFLAIR